MLNKKSDIQKLTDEISRLMAALEDVNFECQRLEIINSNLDFQLKSVNRELKQNITMLEALEEENKKLKEQLKNKQFYSTILFISLSTFFSIRDTQLLLMFSL